MLGRLRSPWAAASSNDPRMRGCATPTPKLPLGPSMLVGDGWQGQENGSIGEVWPLMTSSMPLRRIGRARRISLARACPFTLQECSAKNYFTASGRIRIRAGSMTVKCPAQSVLSTIRAARVVPTSATGGIGNRSNTTPEDAGRPTRQASSPKSLSKVSTIRASRAAHASTSSS
jgi:hypothetical protein